MIVRLHVAITGGRGNCRTKTLPRMPASVNPTAPAAGRGRCRVRRRPECRNWNESPPVRADGSGGPGDFTSPASPSSLANAVLHTRSDGLPGEDTTKATPDGITTGATNKSCNAGDEELPLSY
jgi:hypothetical protein